MRARDVAVARSLLRCMICPRLITLLFALVVGCSGAAGRPQAPSPEAEPDSSSAAERSGPGTPSQPEAQPAADDPGPAADAACSAPETPPDRYYGAGDPAWLLWADLTRTRACGAESLARVATSLIEARLAALVGDEALSTSHVARFTISKGAEGMVITLVYDAPIGAALTRVGEAMAGSDSRALVLTADATLAAMALDSNVLLVAPRAHFAAILARGSAEFSSAPATLLAWDLTGGALVLDGLAAAAVRVDLFAEGPGVVRSSARLAFPDESAAAAGEASLQASMDRVRLGLFGIRRMLDEARFESPEPGVRVLTISGPDAIFGAAFADLARRMLLRPAPSGG